MIKYLRDQSHPQYSSCNIYRLTHMSYVPNTKSFHMTRPNHHLGWLSATAPFGSTNWGHETKEDPEIPPTLLLQVLGFLGCEKMGGKILDSNLYKPGYHLWLKNDTKVDGIFVNFKMAGCLFFPSPMLMVSLRITQNLFKKENTHIWNQLDAHKDLQVTSCCVLHADIVIRKICRIFLAYDLILLLTNVNILAGNPIATGVSDPSQISFDSLESKLTCPENDQKNHGMWTSTWIMKTRHVIGAKNLRKNHLYMIVF